jgi:2-amino-4-hydroxy-6-hydroxymethyldihydropteridine diphosphokinase
MHWFPAYVGLGSNLDEPAARVQEALSALRDLPDCCVFKSSPLYGSRPLGPVVQPDFCNAVVGLLTRLAARDLLRALRTLEQQLGREPRRERWGPRRIDLDLLVYGTERLATEELTVPHPGIVQRNFVLYPLAEVAPDLVVPGLGRVAELKRSASGDGLWRMDGKSMTVNA